MRLHQIKKGVARKGRAFLILRAVELVLRPKGAGATQDVWRSRSAWKRKSDPARSVDWVHRAKKGVNHEVLHAIKSLITQQQG
ncbi:MAG: hypothetical protein ACI9KD_003129 [Congregibacter sp.]|jgi:hypothetical protein